MNRPLSVEPKSGFRLQLVFPDGIEGVINLCPDVGRGVFAPLSDEAFFRTVHIGKHGQISWSEDIEICSDVAYEGPIHFSETSLYWLVKRCILTRWRRVRFLKKVKSPYRKICESA